MLTLKQYVTAVIDLCLVLVAVGGLLFACTNQEADRQRESRDAATIQNVVLHAPLDTLVNLDESLWRITAKGLAIHIDPELGLLVDIRYWSKNVDAMVANIKNAGYTLDYMNPVNQRLRLWVKTRVQLQQLVAIEGVTAVSVSTDIPKRELSLKAFDERKK
ncbi:hypothetical protein DOK_09424 [gamma proteobacterium BDW918]|jgi:hypothetical protein|uniref:Uncharacterized protein n=1 Tax=Zhongshania aliphaticivorans TaxID=1470434 RepID=A0A127M651_9GAMM|nr:hypothetical protein [Zhongshania aliphaticivorans]AMO68686.1 hypothetical protein AZF00_10430 [Zhongshania aliphaticivorans]EIF43385.1 hypothetical protein DOK_09424 [gamma proteobacterium BDW918]